MEVSIDAVYLRAELGFLMQRHQDQIAALRAQHALELQELEAEQARERLATSESVERTLQGPERAPEEHDGGRCARGHRACAASHGTSSRGK